MRVWPYIYAHNHAWQMKTASAMTWLHCICQIKAQRVKSHIFLHISFATLSFSFLALWHPSFSFPPPSSPFSPISPPFAVFPRLTSPAPPLPLLDSPHRVEDLLADPDPTHKRRVDNQLPLSSGLNRSSSEFPRDAMPSESGLLPIIPHLLSHSSLIFGSLIPAPFGFCASASSRMDTIQFEMRLLFRARIDDQTDIQTM